VSTAVDVDTYSEGEKNNSSRQTLLQLCTGRGSSYREHRSNTREITHIKLTYARQLYNGNFVLGP